MNFSNVNACTNALEQKIFCWKIGYISKTTRDIAMLSKVLLLGKKNKKYFTSDSNSFSEDLQDCVQKGEGVRYFGYLKTCS